MMKEMEGTGKEAIFDIIKFDLMESSLLLLPICFFFWHSRPPVGQGLLIHEVSRSHTTTHHTR